jgi:hypothetical protein
MLQHFIFFGFLAICKENFYLFKKIIFFIINIFKALFGNKNLFFWITVKIGLREYLLNTFLSEKILYKKSWKPNKAYPNDLNLTWLDWLKIFGSTINWTKNTSLTQKTNQNKNQNLKRMKLAKNTKTQKN